MGDLSQLRHHNRGSSPRGQRLRRVFRYMSTWRPPSTGVITLRHLFLLTLLASSSAMATDVSVSVTVGDPSFYGRIEIGSYPQPRLLFPQAIVIQAGPVGVVRAPMYLRVPPGHE